MSENNNQGGLMIEKAGAALEELKIEVKGGRVKICELDFSITKKEDEIELKRREKTKAMWTEAEIKRIECRVITRNRIYCRSRMFDRVIAAQLPKNEEEEGGAEYVRAAMRWEITERPEKGHA